jgi:hypothetical protein
VVLLEKIRSTNLHPNHLGDSVSTHPRSLEKVQVDRARVLNS